MEQFELIAKTFQGLEEVLAQELIELGANDVQIARRAVSFTGDQKMMYRANFCLRTAIRILKPIRQFTAHDADEVYDAVRKINWMDYLDLDTTFAVDSVVYSDDFRHSKFVAYKVKDAIVDYFRDTTGQRPNIRITNPDIRLNIHIADTKCTLSLDSSGESLHLRGYRTASVAAPLNEVLAAGLIKLSGWDFQSDFIDPFCGSGTLLVEAALMARNIHPGIFRKQFGFEKWKDFNKDLLDEIYNDDSEERPFPHHLYGYDLNIHAVEAATANSKAAGVADLVTIRQQDIRKFEQPAEPAIIITNPPYGERLTGPEIPATYHALGERLKKAFAGGEAWVISSKYELFDEIGMKASTRIPLVNGSIDCELRKYVIFNGSMREFRAAGGEVKTAEDRRNNLTKRKNGMRREADEHRHRRDDLDPEEMQYEILRSKHQEFERHREIQHRKSQAANYSREYHGERDNERGKFRSNSRFGHDDRRREGNRNEERHFRRDERPYSRNGFRKSGGRKDYRGGKQGFRKD